MWYFVFFIASVALSYALAPKIQEPDPTSLEDVNVPTAEPGRGIPIIFGTVIVRDPNTVWYGDLLTWAITK